MQAQTTNQDDDFTPLPDNTPLPTMLTLYRRDMLYLSNDDLSERVRQCLDLPLRIVQWFCNKHPAIERFKMDYIQEANIQLLQVDRSCPHDWDLKRFTLYAGYWIRGEIYKFLSSTCDIYIPPRSRSTMARRGEQERLNQLQYHLSFDILLTRKGRDAIEYQIGQTNIDRAMQQAAQNKIEGLLCQLPGKEKEAIVLYYGIDGHAHSTTEIAQLLHCTNGYVITLVETALKRLRNEEYVRPAREWLTRNRAERLQTIYEQYNGKIGSTELCHLAKCNKQIAAKYIRMRKRDAEEHIPASLLMNDKAITDCYI